VVGQRMPLFKIEYDVQLIPRPRYSGFADLNFDIFERGRETDILEVQKWYCSLRELAASGPDIISVDINSLEELSGRKGFSPKAKKRRKLWPAELN